MFPFLDGIGKCRESDVNRARVYQRATNAWAADWSDVNGKRHRKVVGRTKAEAQVALAKLVGDVFEGKWRDTPKVERILFADFALNEYLPWAKANLKTWDRTEDFLLRAVDHFKGLALYEVTPALVEKYKTALTLEKVPGTDRPLAPRTVQYALVTLKAVFTKAVVWQKATANPVRPVKMPVVNNIKDRFLDAKEVQALLSASEQGPEYLFPLVAVLLNCGLRIGEALALGWADVDLGKGLLTVRHGKGDKRRVLPLNEATRDALRRLVTPETVLDAQEDHVFTYRGKRVTGGRSAFETARTRAGLGGDVTPHTLRHTFAATLASNGVDLLVLRDLMGHSSVNVTVARYAHLFPDRGKRAVDLLGTVWGSPKT